MFRGGFQTAGIGVRKSGAREAPNYAAGRILPRISTYHKSSVPVGDATSTSLTAQGLGVRLSGLGFRLWATRAPNRVLFPRPAFRAPCPTMADERVAHEARASSSTPTASSVDQSRTLAAGSRLRRMPRRTVLRSGRSGSQPQSECVAGNHAARRTSSASARIRGPMIGESASVVTNSTRHPSSVSRSSESAKHRPYDFACGVNCTSRSTSLPGCASPRRTEPKRARRATPSPRISCSCARSRATA